MAVQDMAMASAGNNQNHKMWDPNYADPWRQLTLDWSSSDKYSELRNIRME